MKLRKGLSYGCAKESMRLTKGWPSPWWTWNGSCRAACCPCINWFEFIGDKVGDPYQNQIAPLRKYIKTLYEKYKHVGRGFYYISNTEMVAKQWYDFAGQRNQSEGWGNLILEEYLSDNIRIEEGY